MSSEGLFTLEPRDRAIVCLKLAAEAEAIAKKSFDPDLTHSYHRIAQRWTQLAAEAEAEARAQEEPPLPHTNSN